MARSSEIADLHPIMREKVRTLQQKLRDGFEQGATLTNFLIFETYRSPEDQDGAALRGSSKAKRWQSPHQYGLAVDFVPWTPKGWNWDDHNDWPYLKLQAQSVGLDVPIRWDLVHVEHPLWKSIWMELRRK